MEYRCAVVVCSLLLTACVVSGTSSKEPQKDKKVDGKIVGGKAVDITNAAYTASLARSSTRAHFCGGSIIHPNFILTAAHCVSDVKPSQFFIRTGSTFSAKGGEVTPVAQVIIHPLYNSKTVVHDIALVRTSRQITKGGMVKLARSPPTAGQYGLVTGWGVKHEKSDQASDVLNFVWLPFLPHATCESAYSKVNKITDNMFCAGYAAGGKDACQGDSGGPILNGAEQVGVVSWGMGCARAGRPGVFTYVPNYLQWIGQYVPYTY